MTDAPPSLPSPADYFPLARGRYEVAAGLMRLGTDLGNGAADGHIFQLDCDWVRYREAKLASRAEARSKYVCRAALPLEMEREAARMIVQRLVLEHPQYFSLTPPADKGRELRCGLTGDTLVFNRGMELDAVRYGAAVDPPYSDALDALACQLQEDFALDHVEDDGRDELVALHICLPNHWAPEEKLGRSFAAVHGPVPNFERLGRQSAALLRAVVERGPFVRFAWGLATDTRLNHHPLPPRDAPDTTLWRGRRFDPAVPELFMRIERQATWGLSSSRAFLFTIRTYFRDVRALDREQRCLLAEAVESMDVATQRYKGLLECQEDVLRFLNNEAGKR